MIHLKDVLLATNAGLRDAKTASNYYAAQFLTEFRNRCIDECIERLDDQANTEYLQIQLQGLKDDPQKHS